MMDLNVLHATDPWDWPKETPALLLEVLKNAQATEEDLLKAVEMAGEFCVINDDLALALLAIVGQEDKPERIRGLSAIALGPALEDADTFGFEDPDDVPISETSFETIQSTFETLFANTDLPKEVRRRILEASVRAPQAWHKDAIRAAYADPDTDWELTAVFCMRFVHGFKKQILKAMESDDTDIHCEAICAAGDSEVGAAWAHIEGLLTQTGTEKSLLLAAIEAAIQIRPLEGSALLTGLLNSDDEDVVDVVNEALAMAGDVAGLDYDDDQGDDGTNDDWD
jgi:hypothetical protein